MKTRTSFEIEPLSGKISYHDNIITIGSCFAQHIGQRLEEHKCNVLNNPWGTLFNPQSIATCLNQLKRKIENTDTHITQSHGIFVHHDYHSSLNGKSKEELTANINKRNRTVRTHLANSKAVIITLGTSLVYRLIEDSKIVANCHKQSADRFIKSYLTFKEINDALTEIVKSLRSFDPNMTIIWTVSPVRHIKDGAIASSRSKATLLAALHSFLDNQENQFYFPAFEIMMDDLREYRYYKVDMVHPSEQAISYIWEKFMDFTVQDELRTMVSEVAKIKSALLHRPFNPSSKDHQNFLIATKEKIHQLERKYNLDFKNELEQLQNQITQS